LSSLSTCIQNFAPIGLLKPHPEHVPLALDRDAEREVPVRVLVVFALEALDGLDYARPVV